MKETLRNLSLRGYKMKYTVGSDRSRRLWGFPLLLVAVFFLSLTFTVSARLDSFAFVSNYRQRCTFKLQRLFSTTSKEEPDDEASRSRRQGNEEYDRQMRAYNLQGWPVSPQAASKDEQPKGRIKAKFDKLFEGMPSVSDIFSSSSEDVDTNEENPTSPKKRRRGDDSWFQAEKLQIEAQYQGILHQALQELQEQRRKDPDSVPGNAEAMLRDVWKEELEQEIRTKREQRAKEQLELYENKKFKEMEQRDISGPPEPAVQELIDLSEQEYGLQEANRAKLDNFLRYEEEVFRRAAEEELTESQDAAVPQPGPNLDEWVLERLQAMAEDRQNDDGGEEVLDILEGNVEDLRNRLQKETRRGSILPETMKEWQVYRSIATRLAQTEEDEDEKLREERIITRLDSWKEYIQKETEMRKEAGLASGAKLPFAWMESTVREPSVPQVTNNRSAVELRKEINRKSIEAMESLLEKTDPSRRENLQRELAYLKEALEGRDYLDIDIEEVEENVLEVGPVDISDVFRPFSEEVDAKTASRSELEMHPKDAPMRPKPDSSSGIASSVSSAPPPPPETPFFSDSDSTFSNVAPEDSKLGSFEEQRLQAMFRRSGIRSAGEQEAIRKQWEDFKNLEERKRLESGLSANSETDLLSSADLKYNISEVVRQDGDFDAQKILDAIGRRPGRKSTGSSEARDVIDTDESSFQSSIGEQDVVGALYRSVAAVGGGRYKDNPDLKAKEEAAFQDLLEKEKEMRQSLEKLESKQQQGSLSDKSVIADDVKYAEEVLASLGPRPKPKKEKVIDAGEFSDMGGILSSEEDEEEEEDEDLDSDQQGAAQKPTIPDTSMPEWLRKEKQEERRSQKRRRFSGSDIDEVFDDDDYDKKMRQLHEYEQRRAGKQRQMGIDISDVLGRSYDDYADYKYDDNAFRIRQGDWGEASFISRKNDLIEYVELDAMEVNSLMDHKDSVYTTGVSQYLPRINRPFRQFGAIFRLEGVLIDIVGLQEKAWNHVADSLGFRKPDIEDIMRAAVIRPELAVKDIFFWTDDIIECRKAASAHRDALKEAFETWGQRNGIDMVLASTETDPKGSLAIGHDAIESPSSSPGVAPMSGRGTGDAISVGSSTNSWTRTAEKYRKPLPSSGELFHAASLSPEDAITKAFRWTANDDDVGKIAQTYRELLKSSGPENSENVVADSLPDIETANTTRRVLDRNAVMEIHFQAWHQVAETFKLRAPEPDEVMAAFVINDPEVAVTGFGWKVDSEVLKNIVTAFKESVENIISDQTGSPPISTTKNSKKATPASADSIEQRSGSIARESLSASLELHVNAWKAVATKFGMSPPTKEQIAIAMTLDLRDVIKRFFAWSNDEHEVDNIVVAFEETLQQLAPRYGVNLEKKPEQRPPPPASKDPTPDDIFRAAADSWLAVASMNSLSKPDNEQVQFAFAVGPEEAVLNGFQWTDNPDEAKRLVEDYKKELSSRRAAWQKAPSGIAKTDSTRDSAPSVSVAPSAYKWIKSLLDVEMPCGVVSFLERAQVDVLLDFAGLSGLFSKDRRVTASNGYNIDSQQLLGAALRLERRPDHCVVFDSSPYASIAAHELDMRNVNLVGAYPRYELLSADMTTSSFDQLTAMNIRRLFGERVYDQPQVETEQALPKTQRPPKTLFWEEE